MEAKAYLKYVRISPRKVSIVLDLIRGKDAATAMAILKHTPKAASEHIIKLLNRTVANAENNFHMNRESLVRIRVLCHPRPHSQANDAARLREAQTVY